MITAQAVSTPVITNISAVAKSFKIKASPRVFKILSSFYSDPVGAIPRELGANAWDAHVAAKNTETKFLVHAPNELEPFFSIRDYGTGLSAENIDLIYTTYFESTKTNDNDSDGCMGLGSKTPFNYTENFTVTSWFGGKKSVYNCFVSEAGVPSILPVYEEASDEHTGMEIKFAVKKDDINTFITKITNAYFPFRHRPEIVGANITYPERKYLMLTETFGVRDTDGYRSDQCRAFMGNYSYPIESSYVLSRMGYNNPNYSKVANAFNSRRLDLFFNIGDLEVAPNKEQLQYDANHKTSDAIIARMEEAIVAMTDHVKKEIGTPATLWEAMALYSKYNQSYDNPFSVFTNIIGDIPVEFNGQQVKTSMQIVQVHSMCKLISGTSTNNYGLYGSATEKAEFEKMAHSFQVHEINFNLNRHGDVRMKLSRRTNYTYRSGRKFIVLYTNTTFKKARVRYWVQKNYPAVYNGTEAAEFLLIEDTSTGLASLKAHQKLFGWSDAQMIDADTLPKPPVVPRTYTSTGSGRTTKGMIKSFDVDRLEKDRYGRINGDRDLFDHEMKEIKDGETYYFIDLYGADFEWKNCPAGKSGHFNREIFHQGLSYLRMVDAIPAGTRIYGVIKGNRHMKKVGKWVNVMDLVAKTIKKNAKKIGTDLYTQTHKSQWETGEVSSTVSYYFRSEEFLKRIKNKKSKAQMKEIGEYYRSLTSDQYSHISSLLRFFGIEAVKHDNFKFKPEDVKKITVRYMNIFTINTRPYYGNVIETIANLVNFIDEKA